MEEKKQKKEHAFPRAIVGALIVNDEGKILLGESAKWIGKWTIFGGKVELGEKMEEAILREAKEEVGVSVKIKAQLDFSESVFDKDFKGDKHFIFLDFLCSYDGKEKIKFNDEYTGEYRWVTIDEAEKMNIAVGTKQAIDKYKKHLEQNKLLDGWKRCQADFENYKKMQNESQKDFLKYAAQNVIMQIIPVLDNFHMSTDHVPEDQKDNAWVVGIMHIQKQLENILAENGVEEIEAKEGDEFDPNIHEAVENSSQSIVHSSEKKNNDQEPRTKNHELIQKILLKGYKLNGKVLRPVKVIVG